MVPKGQTGVILMCRASSKPQDPPDVATPKQTKTNPEINT